MDEIKMMKNRLNQAYMSLQHLQLQPTLENLQILMGALSALQAAYDYLDAPEAENAETGPELEEDEADG
jgi:hypothetical protein